MPPGQIDVGASPLVGASGRRGIWAEPVADVHGQHDPPVGRPRQRPPGQCPAQPRRAPPSPGPTRHTRSRGPVAPSVLGRQAGLDQGLHRAIGTQDRVGELEERIGTALQAVVEVDLKAGQHAQCLACGHIGGEAHRQRPFFRASLLDISKREERPRHVPSVSRDLSRSSDLRCQTPSLRQGRIAVPTF
jgi:hypothetical protein